MTPHDHPLTRREALQIGIGMFGLSLPAYLQKLHAGEVNHARRDVSCICLFLAGGISHFESWDPKPDAPEGIRGMWKPAATNVPGIFITEKMPLMAQKMNKVTIVRSWKGINGDHAGGSQHVMSGVLPTGQQYFPNFGCVYTALRGLRTGGMGGMPPYVGLPVDARYTNPTGYLGPAYGPYTIDGDPSSDKFGVKGMNMPRSQFDSRQSLLKQIDTLSRVAASENKVTATHSSVYEEAVTMLTSGAVQKAANLAEEPLALRERYGLNVNGQRVLLARRLVEAGARFVTINHAVQGGLFGAGTTNGTWDNHQLLFESMMSFKSQPPAIPKGYPWHCYDGPGNLPQLDMSLSTLLEDLDQRGMLDTTLVVAMGEFGRTPKINSSAGRDHYPRAGSVLLAGAGVRGGNVIGATDRNGTEPSLQPCTPGDFAASIYHALGIDHHTTYYPRLPRPTPIADGEVIQGLFA
jgi:hypothetical protein